MINIDNVSQSFKSTLVDSDLSSLVKDGAEYGIDSLINDGIVKDIPIIGTFVGLINTTQNISTWLFLKKIIAFLRELDGVDKSKRERMINKIDSSKKYRKKVGDQLLFILDSCEDDIKAEYIAYLFKAYIKEEVSYDKFIKGSAIINRLTTADFDKFINHIIIDIEDTEFIGVGLAYTYTSEINVDDNEDYKCPTPNYKVSGGETEIEITSIGVLLKKIFKSRYGKI